METHPRPTPEQARAALADAQRIHDSVGTATPPPWWFFPALAVLVAPTPLTTLIPDTLWGIIGLIGAVAVWSALLGIVVALGTRNARVVHRVDLLELLPIAIPVAVLALAATVLYLGFDQTWAVTALVEIVAVGILVGGLYSRNRLLKTASTA